MTRKAIPMEQFTIQVEAPSRQSEEMCVNILENGHFNLNGRLTRVLGGKKLELYFTKDYQHMCLKPSDTGVQFPKSGSCKLHKCVQSLKEAGIVLPAKYSVWKPENTCHWQGDLTENPTQKRSGVRHSSKAN